MGSRMERELLTVGRGRRRKQRGGTLSCHVTVKERSVAQTELGRAWREGILGQGSEFSQSLEAKGAWPWRTSK